MNIYRTTELTDAQAEILCAALDARGPKMNGLRPGEKTYDYYIRTKPTGYPFIFIKRGKSWSGMCNDIYTDGMNGVQALPFGEFMEKLAGFNKLRQLILTPGYIAAIKDNEVVVGCQSIPFAKVDELHKLIHENN